jgi:hypothetical protein
MNLTYFLGPGALYICVLQEVSILKDQEALDEVKTEAKSGIHESRAKIHMCKYG